MSKQENTDNGAMLRIGAKLRSIYRIDRYLSSGGFGKTYAGYNTEFGERIAIKEFFLKGVVQRNDDQTSVSISNSESHDIFEEQKEKFKKEARRLRKLKNEHIVGVHDLFEENGTAYYVMDYVDGENLREKLERTGKPLSEDEVWKILPQVLDALKTVHEAGFWHLDLKPGNIMLNRDGVVKLIDFGASKQLDKQKGGATAHTSVTFTNGYAPREQMEKNYEKMGPWTDIYALGATLYALLTNERPPLPSDIDDDLTADKHEALPLPSGVSKKMRDLIIKMMDTNRNRRPQSIKEVMSLMGINAQQTGQTNQGASADSEGTEFVNFSANNNNEETGFVGSSATSDYEETEFVCQQDAKADETIINNVKTAEISSNESNNNDVHGNEDDNQWKGWLKIGGIIVAIIAVYFIFYAPKHNSTATTAPGLEYVDTAAVDTFAADTVANSHVEYVVNRTCDIDGMGRCSYTGYYDIEYDWPDGEGEAKFSDGRYYKGEFYIGDMHGKAFFKYANGDTFEGTFEKNKFHYGTYTLKADGSYFKGYFKNGKPSKGKWYDQNGNILENVG